VSRNITRKSGIGGASVGTKGSKPKKDPVKKYQRREMKRQRQRNLHKHGNDKH